MISADPDDRQFELAEAGVARTITADDELVELDDPRWRPDRVGVRAVAADDQGSWLWALGVRGTQMSRSATQLGRSPAARRARPPQAPP